MYNSWAGFGAEDNEFGHLRIRTDLIDHKVLLKPGLNFQWHSTLCTTFLQTNNGCCI